MIRVIHIPGRTPYARKLHEDGIQILNGSTVAGRTVPQDVALAWLLEHRPWRWLDVVHLHHLDFEPPSELRAVLADCRRHGKRVVFTVHDTQPIFGDRVTHHRRLRILAEHGVPFVCLTPVAAAEVRLRFSSGAVVVPHGYVSPPGTPGRAVSGDPGPTRFLLYGSLRPNRDVQLVLACWRFARHLADTTLHLLLRAPSRASLTEDAAAWRAIKEHAVDPRLQVDVLPFPSDSEVSRAMADADCLLLPYRWGSHSGQLEHAFDLGVMPVASRVGYLPDQVALHDGLVDEPVWFDWLNDAPFEHGARLLEAMQTAHAAIQDGWSAGGAEKFAEHRRREHTEIVSTYRLLYEDAR